jgi:hypothetical protein
MQRQQLIEGIKQKILRCEDDLAEHNLFNLYWTLSYLFCSQLQRSEKGLSYDDLSRSNWVNERLASNLFSEVLKDVRDFQRSGEEGNALLATLLEWAVIEIARPHLLALQRQEVHEPKKIYGVAHATDEVPFG